MCIYLNNKKQKKKQKNGIMNEGISDNESISEHMYNINQAKLCPF